MHIRKPELTWNFFAFSVLPDILPQRSMQVLVTGSTGLTGNHLAERSEWAPSRYGVGVATVTAGLVARRVKVLLAKKRNS